MKNIMQVSNHPEIYFNENNFNLSYIINLNWPESNDSIICELELSYKLYLLIQRMLEKEKEMYPVNLDIIRNIDYNLSKDIFKCSCIMGCLNAITNIECKIMYKPCYACNSKEYIFILYDDMIKTFNRTLYTIPCKDILEAWNRAFFIKEDSELRYLAINGFDITTHKIITWPNSQDMEEGKNGVIRLINDDEGLELFGSCAFIVKNP